jgi:hypothetical protein
VKIPPKRHPPYDQPEICCNGPWPQNSYDVKAERSPSDFDQKFRWVSSFDYQLPAGKGQRFLHRLAVGKSTQEHQSARVKHGTDDRRRIRLAVCQRREREVCLGQ